MKKFFALGLLALTLAVTSACGSEDETMELMWFSDGSEDEVMQDLLDRYEEEEGVKIELVEVAYDDYESRLRTRIRGDEAPALARAQEGQINNFSDHIIPLDDVFDPDDFANVFNNDDGTPLGLPMDVTANGLFVNLDLLEEHDVDYPELGDEVWTWDEFETEMKKLEGQDGVTAPGIFDFQAHRAMPLLYQHGVTIWDEPYSDSNLTSDEAVEAFEMLQRFYEEEFLDDTVYAGTGSAEAFRTGAYGFHMSGNWNVSAYQEDADFDWTVVPMPQGTNRATILGGKHMTAFEDSGMEDEALDFIEWLSEPEQHDYFNEEVPFLSARRDADIDFGDIDTEYQVFQDEIAATDAKYTDDWLTQVMIEGMYPIINKAIEDIAKGEDDVDDILADLEDELEEAWDESQED
ncbi:MAG: ABC transporter substrate-binding protein [Candidatus Izemoplasmataceae bacterium]